MPTSNVVTVASGTGFAVNVAGLNLSTTLSLKDFIVLKNGVPDTLASYTKASATQVNYTGVSLTAATLEFRRVTPTAVITNAQFGTRIRSEDWNNELDRISRRAEEYALNGVGAGSVVSVALPQNDPFGVLWANDIVFPPNRKVVYDKIITLADRASPTFTGIVTLPGVLDTDSSLAAATTVFVKNNLAPLAPLASPTFSGTPVLPSATTGTTQVIGDSTTKLATTAFVAGTAALLAPLVSPLFTGTPTIPGGSIGFTQNLGDTTTKLATTAFVSFSNRPAFDANEPTGGQVIPNATYTILTMSVKPLDTNGAFAAGAFTVPAGGGGLYAFAGGFGVTVNASLLALDLQVNGTLTRRMALLQAASDIFASVVGSTVVRLVAGDVVTARAYQSNSTATTRTIQGSAPFTFISGYRLNT